MKYIDCDSDRRAFTIIDCTLVATGVNVAVIIAIHGFGTMLNAAFSTVSPILETVCTRFC